MIVEYLLGSLSAQEEEAIEERFCLDNNLFDRMLMIRDELIDDYLDGDLSKPQCERFEQNLIASPQQRERVEMGRALKLALALEPLAENPAPVAAGSEPVSWIRRLADFLSRHKFALGLTAAALIACLAGIRLLFDTRWRFAQSRSAQADLERKQQESQQQSSQLQERADQLTDELNRAQRQMMVAPLTLISGLYRGSRSVIGKTQKLTIPPGAILAQLQIPLKPSQMGTDQINSYRIELRAVSAREETLVLEGVEARPTSSGWTVEVVLPTSHFTGERQIYVLTLNRKTAEGKFEDFVDTYSFQIDKKN